VIAGKALAGFFLSGLLMAFLGAMLPAWGYHLRDEFAEIGNHFFALNAGLLASTLLAQRLLPGRSVTLSLALACGLASAGFFVLAGLGHSASSPPWTLLARMGGLALIGVGTGLLNAALFTAISAVYRIDPAATINLAGVMFGSGCVATAVLVAGVFYSYTVGSILFFLGVIPAFFGGMYVRFPLPASVVERQPSIWRAVEDFRSPAAVLFTLLLFFQFGNEWAVAGWLPLFLAQRVGTSPATSILMLAFYWVALLVGRVAAQAALPRVSHGKLLMGSAFAAMLGCLILTLTNNLFGAGAALAMVGGGYAVIYPLVVEKIGHRFPYYHPGFYNGLFSFAVSGGLIAPWSIGFFAQWWGLWVVMVAPLLGSVMVFILLLFILLEAKLTGSER
jgi:FHS family glucose/mannose:H+ symporter-like MFS transporter